MMSGNLDRRITIQEWSKSTDNAGDVTVTWKDKATVWAKVKEAKGSETFDGDRKHDEQEVNFEIRYESATPKSEDRIKYDGQVFDIRSVAEIPRKVGWKMAARRKWHT